MAADPVDLGYDQTAALKFSRSLSVALRRITEATAAYAGFALGVEFAGSTEWLCRHEGCACTDMPANAANDPPGVARLEVFHCNIPAGSVLLCTSRGKNPLIPIVRDLIQEAIHQVELEFEDEDLIRELGSNWESLHSLYEISSDLRTSRNIPDILAGIVDRIVAGRPTLHAFCGLRRTAAGAGTITRTAEVTRQSRNAEFWAGRQSAACPWSLTIGQNRYRSAIGAGAFQSRQDCLWSQLPAGIAWWAFWKSGKSRRRRIRQSYHSSV